MSFVSLTPIKEAPRKKWTRATAKQMRWTYGTVTCGLSSEQIRTHRKNTVTLVPFAVHLEITKAHLRYLLYDERRLHEPC